ncbi:MAG: ADP-ribosylglycohydrolase family protein [Myxococcales bacterium]|nr:ADP-ribosylglycohydrolase family protein [Myxococcales bacterium]
MEEIVQLDGDIDTIASMYGQMVGARCGVSALPQAWLVSLPQYQEMIELGDSFSLACSKLLGWGVV